MGNPKEDNILNVESPFGAIVVWQSDEANTEELVGDGFWGVKHSYARVVIKEGLKRGSLVPIDKWARAVICESQEFKIRMLLERLLLDSWVWGTNVYKSILDI